jgi:predicted enzyme related to lactoylglutathione lyase
MSEEASLFRPGGISYVRIPAPDPDALAAFYVKVFGWSIREHGESRGFTDRSGHVIGHFVSDQSPTADHGIRPYIYVESVADTIAQALGSGASVATEPYPEGNLTIATVRDPAGNTIGIWEQSRITEET